MIFYDILLLLPDASLDHAVGATLADGQLLGSNTLE